MYKINVDNSMRNRLRETILDFKSNNSWYIPYILINHHPNICNDIFRYITMEGAHDRIIWNNSIDGSVTCKKWKEVMIQKPLHSTELVGANISGRNLSIQGNPSYSGKSFMDG